jgi:hypothetical protein
LAVVARAFTARLSPLEMRILRLETDIKVLKGLLAEQFPSGLLAARKHLSPLTFQQARHE